MTRAGWRIAAAATAAVLIALAGRPLPPAARAAGEGLVVVADAHYLVLPEEGRVRVTVDAVATSREPNTDDGVVYFSGLSFAVQPGATHVAATAAGRPIEARITDASDTHTTIEVSFGQRVFFRDSYAYQVTFDLVDRGGDSDRELRVGRSVVGFSVWAFGSGRAGGGSVRVELPGDFTPSVVGSDMTERDVGGSILLESRIDDPLAFFAYVTADRPGAFEERHLDVQLAESHARLLLRGWDDDPAWTHTVASLLRRGLPELETQIGVRYPLGSTLSIEETATSRLGDYAGLYDQALRLIHVRYDTDPFVTLHEAAHIWFNGNLFEDRWINEAWAEYYGIEAGRAIGETGEVFRMTDALRRYTLPLNDWGALGFETPQVEEFAYTASYELAQSIADRAETAGLQAVWQAAAGRERAYQPVHANGPPRTDNTLPAAGWQRLLDLLEERTHTGYADLWTKWVVNEDQQHQLAVRASVRSAYREVIADAGDWEIPEEIRQELGRWDFADANELIGAAARVLAQWQRVERLAGELGLEAPDTVRPAFESRGGLPDATDGAALQLEVLATIHEADRRLAQPLTVLESIGLLGEDPGGLDDATAAYERGDLGAAGPLADGARQTRDAADDEGRSRVIVAGGGLLALDGLALTLAAAQAARRRPKTPQLDAGYADAA